MEAGTRDTNRNITTGDIMRFSDMDFKIIVNNMFSWIDKIFHFI